MAKPKNIFIFEVGSGTPTWGYDTGSWTDSSGLRDPKFSRLKSVWDGSYPDLGLRPGKVPHLIYGEHLDEAAIAALPKEVSVGGFTPKTQHKHPEDINRITDGELCQGGNSMVSQRLKDVIEALEPGVHQFIPFRFVNCVTREPIWTSVPWYFLNVRTWIAPDELFDWQAMGSAVRFSIQPPPIESAKPWTNMRFPLHFDYKKYIARSSAIEDALTGKHLWLSCGYFKNNHYIVHMEPLKYCSPELRKAIKAAGLKGSHFIPLSIGNEIS